MNDLATKLSVFASLVEQQQRNRFAVEYPGPSLESRMANSCTVTVKLGSKYARVDVGTSGKYMVNLATEEIVGIKGYGVPHLGHHYGTLDTINEWNWGGYHAVPAVPQIQASSIN